MNYSMERSQMLTTSEYGGANALLLFLLNSVIKVDLAVWNVSSSVTMNTVLAGTFVISVVNTIFLTMSYSMSRLLVIWAEDTLLLPQTLYVTAFTLLLVLTTPTPWT